MSVHVCHVIIERFTVESYLACVAGVNGKRKGGGELGGGGGEER